MLSPPILTATRDVQEVKPETNFTLLATKCVELVRRRRADIQTYTDPLDPLEISSSQRKRASEERRGHQQQQSRPESLQQQHLQQVDDIDRHLALAMYPETVGEYFQTLVLSTPQQVEVDEFWRRYFWRCSEKRVLEEMMASIH